jgi:hypothetical protein
MERSDHHAHTALAEDAVDAVLPREDVAGLHGSDRHHLSDRCRAIDGNSQLRETEVGRSVTERAAAPSVT